MLTSEITTSETGGGEAVEERLQSERERAQSGDNCSRSGPRWASHGTRIANGVGAGVGRDRGWQERETQQQSKQKRRETPHREIALPKMQLLSNWVGLWKSEWSCEASLVASGDGLWQMMCIEEPGGGGDVGVRVAWRRRRRAGCLPLASSFTLAVPDHFLFFTDLEWCLGIASELRTGIECRCGYWGRVRVMKEGRSSG